MSADGDKLRRLRNRARQRDYNRVYYWMHAEHILDQRRAWYAALSPEAKAKLKDRVKERRALARQPAGGYDMLTSEVE